MDNTIHDLVKPLQGHAAHNIKLGHGSFLTINFGKNRIIEVPTNKGIVQRVRGEWYLWVYMCAWRFDKNDAPYLGSDDEGSREEFQTKLSEIDGKKLIHFDILNSSFDTKLEFEEKLVINLFSISTQNEQWKLFNPDKKVLVVGPGKNWIYREEDE